MLDNNVIDIKDICKSNLSRFLFTVSPVRNTLWDVCKLILIFLAFLLALIYLFFLASLTAQGVSLQEMQPWSATCSFCFRGHWPGLCSRRLRSLGSTSVHLRHLAGVGRRLSAQSSARTFGVCDTFRGSFLVAGLGNTEIFDQCA